MYKTKKILIIEDEKIVSGMYKEAFSKEGFLVSVAKNHPLGLKMVKKEKPDLILLDLLIPAEDSTLGQFDFRLPLGLDILKQIKRDPELKHIKVIILTNLEADQNRLSATAVGAEEFIIKTEKTPGEIVELIRQKLV